MTISTKRIRYCFGETTSWDGKPLTEGLPVLDHFDFVPVTDSTSGAEAAKGTPGTDADDYNIGNIYWTAEPVLRFTPAHAAKLLDNYFEDAVVGAAANYTRTWELADIPDEPTHYLAFSKNVSKNGHDYVESAYNGVVTGFTIQGSENGIYQLVPRLAFAGLDPALTGYGSDSCWEIDWTTGNTDPIKFAGTAVVATIDTIGVDALKVSSIRITCSGAFLPHYYLTQTPDRWTRGKKVVEGEISFRDIDSEVEHMRTAMKSSLAIALVIVLPGSVYYYLNVKVSAVTADESGLTRTARINFIGVEDTGETYETPLRTVISTPQIA